MKGISSAFLVILFITFFAIPQFTSASEMEDLENPTKQEARSGFAVKQTVHVYDQTSKDSQVLKSYSFGHFLKYRTHSKDWYEATVILSGKPETGYIHKGDVNEAPPAITGYSMKSPTKVYAKDSQKSKAIKSYLKGSKLKYKYYNKNWYIATVYLKGKKHTGYISKDDVGAKKPKVTAADKFKTIDKNDQLILVTSKGYKTNKAAIQTFEKKNGEWKQVLSVQGHIGKNGFAKSKKEGDGKSPTGKYSIGTAFGQKGNPGTKLAFKDITGDDVWVDDPKSKLYNTWQSRKKTKGQWSSAENMNHRLYTYGFVINYNQKRTSYKGSAIFFHVSNSYTLGCTAASQKNVISIMKWIDPKKNPVIIQTPEKEMSKY